MTIDNWLALVAIIILGVLVEWAHIKRMLYGDE
jgi:hypothetical protein